MIYFMLQNHIELILNSYIIFHFYVYFTISFKRFNLGDFTVKLRIIHVKINSESGLNSLLLLYKIVNGHTKVYCRSLFLVTRGQNIELHVTDVQIHFYI